MGENRFGQTRPGRGANMVTHRLYEQAFEFAIECGLPQYRPDLPAASAAQAGACTGDESAGSGSS